MSCPNRIGPFRPQLCRPLRLELDAETVRDTVDVVEIRRCLIRIHDCSIVEPGRSQSFHVAPLDAPGLQRQLDRVSAERPHTIVELIETSLGDRRGKLWIARFPFQSF